MALRRSASRLILGGLALQSCMGQVLAQTTSVPLAEVLRATHTSALIQSQVKLALTQAKLKREDVLCEATVLDAQWRKLSSQMVAPFSCLIGKRTALITSGYRYFDVQGVRLDARLADLREVAASVTLSRLKLRWYGQGHQPL